MAKEAVINLPQLKVVQDDLEIEYEIETVVEEIDSRKVEIEIGLNSVNEKLSLNENRLAELNKEVDRLTNHSDGLDYMVAVGSGVLTSLIDIFWVGEFNLERGREWGSDKVNQFVKRTAKLLGCEDNDLEGSIKFMEKFKAPSDSNMAELGGARQHHLRDFAHHPTIVGLAFSLLTQFTEKSYGTDTNGNFIIVDVKNKEFIGKNLPSKFLYGVVFWFLHMISDMAGSSNTPGAGTGLPGPLLSFAKELSALPFFKDLAIKKKSLSEWIAKLFNGTLLAERNPDGTIAKPVRFDLRAEIGVGYELGRQAIPVIINECVVRGFYFIRRFVKEVKEKEIKKFNDLNQIDWQQTLPFNNRTIARMLTIATGTFTAIDLGDAAIRAARKSGGHYLAFAGQLLLRVNFVGVGRFAIAVGTDINMGIKQHKHRNERIAIFSEQLHLMNSKVFYLQADSWIAAETTEKTINEALRKMDETTKMFIESWEANRQSMKNIGNYRSGIEHHNEGIVEEINDILKWG